MLHAVIALLNNSIFCALRRALNISESLTRNRISVTRWSSVEALTIEPHELGWQGEGDDLWRADL